MRKITQHFLFLALMLLGARGVSWAQNTPQKYTSAVDERSLQIGDTLAPGFSLTNINTADYLTFQAYRFKFGTSIIENNVAVGITNVTSYGDGDVTINAMGLYYPVDQLGNDGDAWIVVDIQEGFNNDLHYVLAGITLPDPPITDPTVPVRQPNGSWLFEMPGADKLVEVDYYPWIFTLSTTTGGKICFEGGPDVTPASALVDGGTLVANLITTNDIEYGATFTYNNGTFSTTTIRNPEMVYDYSVTVVDGNKIKIECNQCCNISYDATFIINLDDNTYTVTGGSNCGTIQTLVVNGITLTTTGNTINPSCGAPQGITGNTDGTFGVPIGYGELTLNAIPADGYYFAGWYSGVSSATLLSTDNPCTLTVTSDTTLTATFAPLSYLTIDVNDSTRGMAWVNRHGVNLADELYPGHNEGSIFRCNTGTSIVDNCFNNSEGWYNGLWIEARYWENRPTIAYVVFYHGTDSVIVTGSYPQVYLRNGNTYSDYNDNSLLWQGGVSRLRIYTNSYGLPDGVAETSVPGTYAVIPGTVLPIEAVPFSHCHLSGWSSGDTTLTFNYTMGDTFDTLTAYFDSNALLTIAVNAPQMGSVSIPRHQGNSLLVSLKAVDMAGLSSPDFNGIHLFAPDVQQGGTEWTNSSSDWSQEIIIQTNGNSGENEKEKKTTIFYSNHNTRYIMTGGNDNSQGAALYLKNGNTYLDWSCSQLLWEGGVTRLEVYGKGKVLPDGVEVIDEANGLFSVAPGSQVPIQAKANPRYHLDSWSNGDAVTDDLMHTITVTTDTYDTAIFVINPTLTLSSNDINMGSVAFDVATNATRQITIYMDGEANNDQIPIYGNWYDASIHSQYIIPAEEIALMAGGTIRGIRYYIQGGVTHTFSTSSTVYLKEVDYTSYGNPASKDTLTPVCTTNLSYTSDGDNLVMDITFDNPFEYRGGNLLILVDHPQGGNFRYANFIGQEVPNSAYSSQTNSYISFIPKSTFTFTSPMPAGVYAINDTTYSVDPGTELTIKPVAALGYNFSSWEDLSTTPLRSFTMGYNDAAFTASFVASPKLVCLTDGTGTGSVVIDTTGGMPFGVSVNPEGGYFVPAGTQVTLMALPDEENHFVAWENLSTDASRIFTMGNADDTVNATIDINTYILDSILPGWSVMVDSVALTLTPSTAFPGTMQAELPWGHDVEIIPSDTHKPLVRKLEVLLPNSITIGDVTIHYDNGDTWAQAISRPENSVSYVYIENNTVKYIDFTLQLNDVDVTPNDTIQANGEYEWYVEYSGSITLDP